ncbi:MAG: septum formation inhibitor Maf [Clostridia bacterium]|nr:septum formation inhibitor Maf [Clostridia bacterium]
MAFSPLPIYLASASPRRRALLRQVGLPFTTVPSRVREEGWPGGTPADGVRFLALAKAREVASRVLYGLVIGADTVVVLGDEVLGKPSGPTEAHEMLARLSGATHRVLTGLAVVEAASGESLVAHEETAVTFRRLSEAEIASYVASGEPLDKAGAYGVQGLGAVLVERIEGCYYNVVGLPLARLAEMLAYWNVQILG